MLTTHFNSRSTTGLASLLLGTLFLTATTAFAEPRRANNAKARTAELQVPEPDLGPGMSAPDRWAFKAAYKSALLRILEHDSCAELFTDLDLNGLEALIGTRYELVSDKTERVLCKGGVSAMTSMGSYRTSLCYHFKVLHPNDKISILIHEALHTAGLREFPYAPEAPTSAEITRMVKAACAL